MLGKFLFETGFLETVAFLYREVNPVKFYIFRSTKLEKTCIQYMFKRSCCLVLFPLELSETYILYLTVFSKVVYADMSICVHACTCVMQNIYWIEIFNFW